VTVPEISDVVFSAPKKMKEATKMTSAPHKPRETHGHIHLLVINTFVVQVGPKVFDQFYNSIKTYKLPGKNIKIILFDGYIHKVFFHTLSALYFVVVTNIYTITFYLLKHTLYGWSTAHACVVILLICLSV
jgi:hypothetical protein